MYVAYGKNSVGTFRTDRLMQGGRPSQVTVNTGSTVLPKKRIKFKSINFLAKSVCIWKEGRSLGLYMYIKQFKIHI